MLSKFDNVATSLADVKSGADVQIRIGKDVSKIKALESIPFGFKIAVTDITKGSDINKYGELIGIASEDIKQGQLVHVHNIQGTRGRGDLVKGDSK
ncbi:UxaA family hydrolase [Chloroflexota bacterium]